MTIENYRKAANKGISGPFTPTCFPAALDSISFMQKLSDEAYARHTTAYNNQAKFGENTRRTRETYRFILGDLGVTSLKGIVGRRAKTESETKTILENAKKGGWRVIITTMREHAVGLRNTSEGWRMVGTWAPASFEERFTSEQIFQYLYQSKERIKGKPTANIILVAPEKKKTG